MKANWFIMVVSPREWNLAHSRGSYCLYCCSPSGWRQGLADSSVIICLQWEQYISKTWDGGGIIIITAFIYVYSWSAVPVYTEETGQSTNLCQHDNQNTFVPLWEIQFNKNFPNVQFLFSHSMLFNTWNPFSVYLEILMTAMGYMHSGVGT